MLAQSESQRNQRESRLAERLARTQATASTLLLLYYCFTTALLLLYCSSERQRNQRESRVAERLARTQATLFNAITAAEKRLHPLPEPQLPEKVLVIERVEVEKVVEVEKILEVQKVVATFVERGCLYT